MVDILVDRIGMNRFFHVFFFFFAFFFHALSNYDNGIDWLLAINSKGLKVIFHVINVMVNNGFLNGS